MITFELDRQGAQLQHVNPRSEVRGKDRVACADLKIAFTTGADVLAEFDPSLRAMLFRAPDANDSQAELLEGDDALAKLRFPKLGALHWSDAIIGGTVTVHFGASGKADVVLGGCTIDRFTFTPKDGGSVEIAFRVRCEPDEKQFGKLCSLVQNEIEISVEPPAEDAMQEAA